jgi:hypothetical protein
MVPQTNDHPLILMVPPAIWAACFLVIYASESLVCTRAGSAAVHAVLVTAAGLIATGALAALIWRWSAWSHGGRAESRAFHRSAGFALALLSLLATIWTLLPALILPACAG